jgi:hypothetical protein
VKTACICLLFLALLGACASITHKQSIEWPDRLQYIEASGDLSMSWRNIDFTGMVSLQMDYPSVFVLEIYGMFGQTLAYIKKDGDNFLLVAGDEKSTDKRAFEDRYGLRIDDFIDDLAMKGEKKQIDGATIITRSNYRVIYGQDKRGRRKMTWEGRDVTMQLVFTQVNFTPGEQNAQNSGGKM